jgi:hypothetical protein
MTASPGFGPAVPPPDGRGWPASLAKVGPATAHLDIWPAMVENSVQDPSAAPSTAWAEAQIERVVEGKKG